MKIRQDKINFKIDKIYFSYNFDVLVSTSKFIEDINFQDIFSIIIIHQISNIIDVIIIISNNNIIDQIIINYYKNGEMIIGFFNKCKNS